MPVAIKYANIFDSKSVWDDEPKLDIASALYSYSFTITHFVTVDPVLELKSRSPLLIGV